MHRYCGRMCDDVQTSCLTCPLVLHSFLVAGVTGGQISRFFSNDSCYGQVVQVYNGLSAEQRYVG